MKKEYISPLFEEVVLMTEDVLGLSDPDAENFGDDDIFGEDYDKESEGDF